MSEEERKGQSQPEAQPASQTQELPAAKPQEKRPLARAPKWICELEIGAVSELGRVRDINEDNFLFLNPQSPFLLAQRGALYAVADGMGGHASGQIASELALRTFFDHYYADPETASAEAAMYHAYSEANSVVYSTGRGVTSREGMGTTLASLAIIEKQALIGNVGDSRVYIIHGRNVAQLTQDHSLVAEQVRQGILSAEEATASPFRNVITRCIGNEPSIEPDLVWQDLQPGDILLLCSDGLSNLVKPEEMTKALAEGSPSEAARRLVNLASARGAPDNVTCLIVKVNKILRNTRSAMARWLLWARSLGTALLGAVLMLALLWSPLHSRPSQQQLKAALTNDAQRQDFVLEPEARDLVLARLKSALQEPVLEQQLAAYEDALALIRAGERLEAKIASDPVAVRLASNRLQQEARQRLDAARALLARLPKEPTPPSP